jgi:hypothetical protein
MRLCAAWDGLTTTLVQYGGRHQPRSSVAALSASWTWSIASRKATVLGLAARLGWCLPILDRYRSCPIRASSACSRCRRNSSGNEPAHAKGCISTQTLSRTADFNGVRQGSHQLQNALLDSRQRQERHMGAATAPGNSAILYGPPAIAYWFPLRNPARPVWPAIFGCLWRSTVP